MSGGRRLRVSPVAAVALAAIAALAALALVGRMVSGGLGPGRPGPTPASAPAAPSSLAPGGSPVVARVRVPGGPRQVAVGEGAAWVATARGTIARIDPRSNRVAWAVQVGPTGQGLGAVAAGAGGVWAPTAQGEVWRLDPATGRVTARIPLGRELHQPVGIAATPGAVWLSCCGNEPLGDVLGRLVRIDPATNRVAAAIELPAGPLAVAAAGAQVWVTTTRGQAIRVDPAANRVAATVEATDPLGPPQAVAIDGERVWVASPGDSLVVLLDPRAGRVARRVPLNGPTSLTAFGAAAWVVNTNDQVLTRVAGDGRVGPTVPAAWLKDVQSVAGGPGAVWAVSGDDALRVDPARIHA